VSTKTRKRRARSRPTTKRTTRRDRPAGQPLSRAALIETPGCECVHAGVPCPRPATHRVSLLCAVEDCRTAVHVYLACTPCKESWVRDAVQGRPPLRLRVTAL
jgi:hypothetical protein